MKEPLPLFPTAYLPSVSYMAYMATYNTVAIEQHETFPKQTFRNRAAIATGNGLQLLTVPVVRPQGNHSRTEEMEISYGEPWNIRHWRAIVTAYNTSPFFLYYRDELEEILMAHHEHLIDLNYNLLRYLLKKLKIECTPLPTHDYLPPTDITTDYRYTLVSKKNMSPCPLPPYSQVFDTRIGFLPNLSCIDLLFNLGPEAGMYLKCVASTLKTQLS